MFCLRYFGTWPIENVFAPREFSGTVHLATRLRPFRALQPWPHPWDEHVPKHRQKPWSSHLVHYLSLGLDFPTGWLETLTSESNLWSRATAEALSSTALRRGCGVGHFRHAKLCCTDDATPSGHWTPYSEIDGALALFSALQIRHAKLRIEDTTPSGYHFLRLTAHHFCLSIRPPKLVANV